MKRLIFAMAAVFACALQAITLNWASSGDNSWAANIVANKSALVYTENVNQKYTAADIAQIAQSAKSDRFYTVVTDPSQGSFSLPKLPEFALNGSLTVDNDKLKTSGNYYLVLFTEDNKYAVGHIDGSAKPTNGDSYWYEAGPSTGYPVYDVTFDGTAVVPEPTALALLALGIAGLALRRRA